MQKRDGHIHTPFCPHGSNDTLRQYAEEALKKGFKSITFTEHAPLPSSFTDPTPLKDSAMAQASMERYIDEISGLKKNIADSLPYEQGLRSIILLNLKMRLHYFWTHTGHI